MRRYWNKFLNWLIPNRREQLLTEMMLRDQELGLYNEPNKVREYTSPLIEELLNEVTPEETYGGEK